MSVRFHINSESSEPVPNVPEMGALQPSASISASAKQRSCRLPHDKQVLSSIKTAEERVFKAVGEGEDIRLSAPGLTGDCLWT